MALSAELRRRVAGCSGCRRRRAALRTVLSRVSGTVGKAVRRALRPALRHPDAYPNAGPDSGRGRGAATDFGRFFLIVEHIDSASGTATFRLNGRADEGYRLGLPIPLDWHGRPPGPDLLIEAMAAEALPTVRRELAGAGPPDYSRLKPLEGRRFAIARFIERHYRCEDCRHG